MNRVFYLLFLLPSLLFAQPSKGQATLTLDSTVLTIDTLITGLDIPWDIKWGPDNWIWTTERYGVVSRINPNDGTKKVILNLSASNGGPVYQYLESGLLGMALHPDFVDSPFVYIVYTYIDVDSAAKEKLVRYRYTNDTLLDPVVYIDSVHANRNHDGSRLLISPDRHLFMTAGDGADTTSPQDLHRINGKILRFNLDGSIPTDNPIPGSPIFSWGHRNAQGLLWAPNGIFYSSEHGPDTDDELNILEKGRNYGWPFVRGYCDGAQEVAFCADSNVKEPIAAWTPTIAPSDIAWYDHPAIPEWRGCILMSVLKDMKLIRFQLDSTGYAVTNLTIYLANQYGRLRDVLVAPDGRVFLATNGPSSTNTNPFTHSILELKNANYTGVASIENPIHLQVYPNPASGVLHVTATLPSQANCTIQLFDMMGRAVYQQQLSIATSIQATVPLQGMAEGIYLVSVKVGDKVYHQKVVVE